MLPDNGTCSMTVLDVLITQCAGCAKCVNQLYYSRSGTIFAPKLKGRTMVKSGIQEVKNKTKEIQNKDNNNVVMADQRP